MKQARAFLQVLVGVALLGALVVGLIVVFRGLSERGEAGARAEVTSQPYPPPQTMTMGPTAMPQSTPIVLQPGQDLIHPTFTPFPTFPPPPTPTRRPGPTASPLPINSPAPDASGTIFYGLYSELIPRAIRVDGQGQKVAEPEPLPFALTLSPPTVDLSPPQYQLSPDGRYLFILRYDLREAGGVPYIFDQESIALRPLFPDDPNVGGLGVNFLDWHPDSHHVLVYRHDGDLLLVNVETGEFTVLAFIGGRVRGATIAPNGQEIIYVNGGPNGIWEALWKVSAVGGDARSLLYIMAGEGVSWSPDGASVLYRGGVDFNPGLNPDGTPIGTPVPGGPFAFWLMDPNGQNQRPIVGPSLLETTSPPIWSPDAQWVAYAGGRYEGEKGIYVEHLTTGEIRRLATGIGPVWSPDGSRLAFISTENGASDIWVVGIDGTDLHQLTFDGQPKHNPIGWSR